MHPPDLHSTFIFHLHLPSIYSILKKVRLRDELLRAHNAMGAMKRELDRRNADLESLVASHQENLENTGTDLKDTGVCTFVCVCVLSTYAPPL
jgi:hypothetical protein